MTENQWDITKLEVGDEIVFGGQIFVALEIDEERKAVRVDGEFTWLSYKLIEVSV